MGGASSDLISNLESVWKQVDKAGEGSIGRNQLPTLIELFLSSSKFEISKDLALSYSSSLLPGQKVSKTQVIDFLKSESQNPKPDFSSEAVKRQVEFYFSDENLTHDKFFNEQIIASDGGFVSFDTILKCQRIKNLKVSKESLIQALAGSEHVEVDGENGVRRKNNRAVPLLKVKKAKTQKLPEQTVEILEVTIPEESKTTWKDLRDAFRSKYINSNVVYVRFHGNEGHVGVSSDVDIESIIKGGLEVNGIKAIIKKLEGDQLLEFWKANGSHFDMCSQSMKKRKIEKNKSINMGGKLFSSVSQLKNYVNSLLNGSAEGVVDPHYHNLLVAVSRLHPQFETKFKNMKTFSIHKHPEHPESKCFFVVREDGSEEDFSISKCLQQL